MGHIKEIPALIARGKREHPELEPSLLAPLVGPANVSLELIYIRDLEGTQSLKDASEAAAFM